MKAPIKLVLEGEMIKGIFDQELNFVEGSNSKGYPTAILTTPWVQFPPAGFDEVVKNVSELFVEWYNSRPETIQSFIDGEIDKLFLETWKKDEALKYLTEKLENYPYRDK